jgi:energy-converting hydrogenase Eha subunit B
MFNRIKRGAAIGLAFACLYSLYVTGLYLIQGPEPFQRLGTNLGVVIGTYFFGGISAGVVVGVLQPIARWRLGAMGVGIIAAFFVFFGILVAADGLPSRWGSDNWITLTVLPILFGTFAGNSFWKGPIA